MLINKPCCDFKMCRNHFDGNCINTTEYERCSYNRQKAEIELLQKKKQLNEAEIEWLSDRNYKCIYLSDNETTEFCVDGACPEFKTEKMIKAEAINDFIKKCKEKQEFMRGEDNKYKGYVSIEDLESLKKCD